MYEFFLGVFIGYVGGLVLTSRETRAVGVQATEVGAPLSVAPSRPILIGNLKKKFVPGELRNFWGKDS
jgi:hypothetical protein